MPVNIANDKKKRMVIPKQWCFLNEKLSQFSLPTRSVHLSFLQLPYPTSVHMRLFKSKASYVALVVT